MYRLRYGCQLSMEYKQTGSIMILLQQSSKVDRLLFFAHYVKLRNLTCRQDKMDRNTS